MAVSPWQCGRGRGRSRCRRDRASDIVTLGAAGGPASTPHFLLTDVRGAKARTLPGAAWPPGALAWGRGAAPRPWADGARPSPPGLLWQLRPSDVEVELLAHTRRVVSQDLPAETGLHTGWIQNGGLFIASNRQRLDEYKRLMSVGGPCQGGGAPVGGCAPCREGGGTALAGTAAWEGGPLLAEPGSSPHGEGPRCRGQGTEPGSLGGPDTWFAVVMPGAPGGRWGVGTRGGLLGGGGQSWTLWPGRGRLRPEEPAARGLSPCPLCPVRPQLGKAYGVESHVLSPAETKALYPLMNVDDLYGTLYVPHDGTMDPAGTCSTLARAASARGAQVPPARPWAPRRQATAPARGPREWKAGEPVPFSLPHGRGPP